MASNASERTRTKHLPKLTRLCYGVGHVLNDLCASMWFSYLLVFFHKIVRFDNFRSGILLLIGQIADAVATPLVGIESDRTSNVKYGRRKIWHLGGCLAVACTFPFIFNLCPFNCSNSPLSSLFVYYVPFIIIFQFGWASTQISHLALIPDIAMDKKEKVELNAIRNGFTIFANIFVYTVFWILFEVRDTSGLLGRQDAPKFQILVFIAVSVGIVFVAIFHLGVKEKSTTQTKQNKQNCEGSPLIICKIRSKSNWTVWFGVRQFWQIGGLYMMTRLIINLSQVYIPMYVTDTLFLDKKTIAIIPLVVYVSGILATLVTKPITSRVGLKVTYFFGLLVIYGACTWFWFLDKVSNTHKKEIYGAAVLLGLGGSTLLITSLAMVAELIGDNCRTGAFVYGAMSFLDKLSNGAAVLLIQKFHPGCGMKDTVCHCSNCEEYYKRIMAFVPGGAAILAFIILLTLVSSKIGVLVDAPAKKKKKLKNPAAGYGSTNVTPSSDAMFDTNSSCDDDEPETYEEKRPLSDCSPHSIQNV